jgi:hypothetical protein
MSAPEQTSRERVLQIYPDARVYEIAPGNTWHIGRPYRDWNEEPGAADYSRRDCKTVEEAWDDAARRLPAQPSQPASHEPLEWGTNCLAAPDRGPHECAGDNATCLKDGKHICCRCGAFCLCPECNIGEPRIRSSVSDRWVHTRTPTGRGVCIDPPAEPVPAAPTEAEKPQYDPREALAYLAAHTEGEARAMVEVLSCRLGYGHAAYLPPAPDLSALIDKWREVPELDVQHDDVIQALEIIRSVPLDDEDAHYRVRLQNQIQRTLAAQRLLRALHADFLVLASRIEGK